MTEVIRHVIDSISPASRAHAEGARLRIAGVGAPVLERLAMALAAAQHRPDPIATRRTGIVVAGDHGVGDPGVALGADHPTIAALRQIDAGTAALSSIARSSKLPLLLVDAGVREPEHLPRGVVRVGRGTPTHDLTREPAMTVVDATLALEAGIALVIALDAHDAIVLGALGIGAEVSAAAIVGACTGLPAPELADPIAEAACARGAEHTTSSGLELLAMFGGPETGVLAGAILAAASLNMVVVLDNYATGAAALIATRLAPHARGYLVAAHGGSYVHPRILEHLELTPVFEVGLGHGEGTGAAMIVPLLDQVASLTTRS